MSDYRDLLVWQRAHAVVLRVHAVSVTIRGAHHAALRSQMLRAAMSIPTNIVESRGQSSPREELRFLRYSLNSCSELEYHLHLARDLRAVPHDRCEPLMSRVREVRRMLQGLLRHVTTRDER